MCVSVCVRACVGEPHCMRLLIETKRGSKQIATRWHKNENKGFFMHNYCWKSTFWSFLLHSSSVLFMFHFLWVCHVCRYQIFLKPRKQSGFKKKILTKQLYFPPSRESHVQPPALLHLVLSPNSLWFLSVPSKHRSFEFGRQFMLHCRLLWKS